MDWLQALIAGVTAAPFVAALFYGVYRLTALRNRRLGEQFASRQQARKDEIDAYQEIIGGLRSDIEMNKNRLSDMQQQFDRRFEARNAANGRLRDLLTACQVEKERAEAREKYLEDQIGRQSEEIAQLRDRVQELEREIAEIRQGV